MPSAFRQGITKWSYQPDLIVFSVLRPVTESDRGFLQSLLCLLWSNRCNFHRAKTLRQQRPHRKVGQFERYSKSLPVSPINCADLRCLSNKRRTCHPEKSPRLQFCPYL